MILFRKLSILLLMFSINTLSAQGEFEQLQPLGYVLISDIDTDSETILKNIKKSMNISMIDEYFVQLDTNEWGYKLGPIKLDIEGAGYQRKGLPLMYKDDLYIVGTIEFKSDKYRVKISNFKNSGMMGVYDPSTFLNQPKRRENPNRVKYPTILDHSIVKLFETFDVSDDSW